MSKRTILGDNTTHVCAEAGSKALGLTLCDYKHQSQSLVAKLHTSKATAYYYYIGVSKN